MRVDETSGNNTHNTDNTDNTAGEFQDSAVENQQDQAQGIREQEQEIENLNASQEVEKSKEAQPDNDSLGNPNTVDATALASQQQDQGESWSSFAAKGVDKRAPSIQDSFGHGGKSLDKDDEQIRAAALQAQLQIQKGMLKG